MGRVEDNPGGMHRGVEEEMGLVGRVQGWDLPRKDQDLGNGRGSVGVG